MPPKGLYEYDAIFDVLKELPLFLKDGSLKTAKDPVWKTACKLLPGMKIHNMYIFVMQDRKNIRTNLMKHLNITYSGTTTKQRVIKKKAPPRYSKWDDFLFYDKLDEKKKVKDDLDALLSMKNNGCRKIFHKLGILPFTVIYFHPNQVTLWNDLINIKSTVSLIVLNGLVDYASGKINSDTIYMYALAVKIPNSVVLIAQMISESKDTTEIENFFNSWLQKKALAPTEIVVGYSKSLLDAASLAFNFCTFDEYTMRCYQYIMKTNSTLPPTLILIDIVGIIKAVDSWKSFENLLQTVKDFYLCSIMYLSTLNDLDTFIQTVITIFTLCQSPFQNSITTLRKDTLWVQLTSNTIEKMNQQYINYVTSNGHRCYSFLKPGQNLAASDSIQEIYDFVNQLKQEAFELCDFSIETEKISNDFYCPIILEDLIHLLVRFPSWTKIIAQKPDCSTLVSYCSGKHLDHLKEFSTEMRPPAFLEFHLTKLQGLNRVAKDYVKTCKKTDKFVLKKFKNNHSHLNEQMNPESLQDNRIEINIPSEVISEEIVTEAVEDINMDEVSPSKTDYNQSVNENSRDEQFNNDDSCNDYIEEFESAEDYKTGPNKVERCIKEATFSDSPEEEFNDDELNLEDFKAKIYSTINTLLEFDDFVDNVLRMKIKSGQEKTVCKVFLDCCREMVTYEKFLGEMVRRLCASDEAFISAFEQLFTDCYLTLESFDKHEIKNISELYAYLLSLDCITWEIFSIIKLNENEATAQKRNFLRALLQNLSQLLGAVQLCKKLKEKRHEPAFEGLFPDNSKDALFAGNFFKLSGLKDLGNEVSVPVVKQKNVVDKKISALNIFSGTKVLLVPAIVQNSTKKS